MLRIFAMLLLISTPVWAHGFSPEDGAINSECILTVDNKTTTGPCWAYLEKDGSFRVNFKDQNIFVYVNREPSTDGPQLQGASAYWNEGTESHADTDLGWVYRPNGKGPCWLTGEDNDQDHTMILCASKVN